MKYIIRLLTCGISLVAVSHAHAENIEVGGSLGWHEFSLESELGAPDDLSKPGPASFALLAARVGYGFAKRFAAEVELAVIPTGDDAEDKSVMVLGLRAQARVDLLTGKVRPFVLAGAGAHVLRAGKSKLENDVDQAYHIGLGLQYAVSPTLAVRVDLRDYAVPDRTKQGATSEYEVQLGLTWRFGKAAARTTAEPLPAGDADPSLRDADGDHVFDEDDACPKQAEDVDRFRDDDGCPDDDNDQDGIADTRDKCPNEAETTNGYQDGDGCPDAVLTELTGINFEMNSARFDAASAALLEKAFQTLNANAAIHVEIAGHTSSEGEPQRNLELSLKRAEAVKEYLVRRGISEERLRTAGYGADQPVAPNSTAEGRSRNRRIEFRIVPAGE